MRVLVTRPAREAGPWVEGLCARGLQAQALPLIAIGDAPDAAQLAACWSHLGDYTAVMFVSRNAVAGFFARQPASACWHGPRAWAPGPGTREALLEHGLPEGLVDAPAADAAQFDSESLWRSVGPGVRAGDRVLVVRGSSASGQAAGRDWLIGQLGAVGATVETVAAYSRGCPVWQAQEREMAAEAAADGSVWLFSSSEAIAHLLVLMPQQPWHAARAVATHPRIVRAAQDAGFGVVRASRPELAQVAASIESFG